MLIGDTLFNSAALDYRLEDRTMLNSSRGKQSAQFRLWETLSGSSTEKLQEGKKMWRGTPKIKRDLKGISANDNVWTLSPDTNC